MICAHVNRRQYQLERIRYPFYISALTRGGARRGGLTLMTDITCGPRTCKTGCKVWGWQWEGIYSPCLHISHSTAPLEMTILTRREEESSVMYTYLSSWSVLTLAFLTPAYLYLLCPPPISSSLLSCPVLSSLVLHAFYVPHTCSLLIFPLHTGLVLQFCCSSLTPVLSWYDHICLLHLPCNTSSVYITNVILVHWQNYHQSHSPLPPPRPPHPPPPPLLPFSITISTTTIYSHLHHHYSTVITTFATITCNSVGT